MERTSLSDQVYAYIKAQILSGAIQAGEHIPEERVGRLFGISRTPIREAVKRLEEYGLVRVKPRSYAEVVSFNNKSTVQIAHVRAQLEELSVRLFVEDAGAADLAAVQRYVEACDQAVDAGSIGETFLQDSLLHLEIARRCGNPHLFDVLERFDAKVQLARVRVHLPLETLIRFVRQHRPLMEAMGNRDVQASVVIMRHHILGQLEHLCDDDCE